MDQRSGTGEVVNRIDFDEEWKANVVPHEFETWMTLQVCDIGFATRKETVDAEDLIAGIEQPSAKFEPKNPAPPVTRTRRWEKYRRVIHHLS